MNCTTYEPTGNQRNTIMSRDRKNLLLRIKKCLALGKSSNPHEAAAAMRQAQKLMEMAGLTTEDVALANIITTDVKTPAKKLPYWHHDLLLTVAKGFGCECILTYDFRSKQPVVRFIGTAPRVEVAAYSYTVLRRQTMCARKIFIADLSKNCKPRTKTLRADSYCEGFVLALRAKVQALTLPEEEKNLLEDYMRKHHSNLEDAKAARGDDKAEKERAQQPDYRAQGYLDGQNTILHHAVNGSIDYPALQEF